jgi:cellulose synthase/poly-beta-1,6-N-acetylglucosamine synthase-like glycosyltransferase
MNNNNFLDDIRLHFQKNCWFPAAKIERPFVRHQNPVESPGKIWKYSPPNTYIKASVVIPTLDAHRDGYFEKLIVQISQQKYKHFEVIIIRKDPRQGRAINVGAALAQGKYLITLDDDTLLPHRDTFENLVIALDTYPEIGIAGGNNVIPQGANVFIQRAMKEIPRRSWKPVERITDSDLAEHPLMIMRKDIFFEVGGENEIIIRGLDPYLRLKFRRAGYRVVVIPGAIYSHLPPDSLIKLIRQFYRNGKQAAFCNKFYPQWVIETPAHHTKNFLEKRSILYRVSRFFVNLIIKTLKRHFLYLSAFTVYAIGFTWGYLSQTKNNTG